MSDVSAPEQRPVITEEQRAAVLERVNRPRWRVWRGVVEWAKSFQIAILLALFVKAFFVDTFKIPTGSMEHTILVGDFVLVNKLAYGAEVPFTGRRLPAMRTPKRGEVIVFLYPEDPTKNYVKRLVGLPGDTVAMRRGQLVVNGIREHGAYIEHTMPWDDRGAEEFQWQRPYLALDSVAAHRYHPTRDNWGPLVVPPQHMFVLGDNRDNSSDSRYWGFVADSLLRGAPLFVYYSYQPDSTRPFAWLTGIRWDRLGERIE
ncbi:MAG: signal peptidase I [Gemmatimonadetes bacterium]|nr:signal peptidase I [Gemmatimonadota bacterium]